MAGLSCCLMCSAVVAVQGRFRLFRLRWAGMASFGGASPPHGGVCPPGKKRFEIRYDMPCPALEPALHAQPIILYIAAPSSFSFSFACADRMYTRVGDKAPSVLFCAPLCSPRWCGVRACSRRPVALPRSAGCGARRVPCHAVPRGSGGVCVAASVQLPEARVASLGGTPPLSVAWRFSCSLGSMSSLLPQVFCDPVLWCLTSLNLLSWDITCMRVVCPDARTPCALPWGTRGLPSWCMIFPGVMRAGGLQG